METHFNQILHIRGTIRRSKYCRASYQRPGVFFSLPSYRRNGGVHCSVYSADFFLGSSCGKTLPSIPSRMRSIMECKRNVIGQWYLYLNSGKSLPSRYVYLPEDRRSLNNFVEFFEILKHIAPKNVFPSPFHTVFLQLYFVKVVFKFKEKSTHI